MICRRCGAEFTDPIPEVTNEEGITEIASIEWCADCNRYVMNVIFRHNSAYKVDQGILRDPFRGGYHASF